MKQPVSTYRLQITERFDLRSAAGIADYVRRLGADWIYLSPLLQAEEGSDHGYDVVDTSRIDPARGGAEGLAAASAAARGSGLGVLVDIVPNHMGVATPAQNRWWWDVLEHGRDSRYAEAFDIDWDAGGGKLRLPVLGDGTESDAEAELDDLTIDGDELRYYDNRFPIAAGTATAGATPREVHDRQHYALVNWRRADAELNYRRFFAVNTLAGVRVEVPWVFDESHREILRWIDEGLVDGLRIDHPDGLRDPGGYLERLAESTKGAYVLVEKITEGDEQLPSSWATQGTTGYDALGDFDRVLVDPAGEAPLTALETRLRGGRLQWAQLIHDTKRGIADGILRSEVLRLAREIGAATGAAPGEAGGAQVADAVAELLTCFPVYRSYLPEGLHHLEAAALAKQHRPDLADAIDELVPVLSDAGSDAAKRFQQTSGMVMAKGVEDTAFYRWARLSSLTEVGGDPDEFAITTEEFHERQLRRQESWPAAMTTLSTHDTKRGEDVRARIDVLAEVPEEWAEAVDALQTAVPLGSGRGSDDVFANLLWQAVVGSWPASRERLHAYAEKASREAGDSTTWTDVDEDFEASMHAAVNAAFDDPAVHRILEGVATRLQAPGWSNSLSMKLLQLTAPGVPDVYQGSELWETSLVDPDNRRDVDYAERRRLLDELDAGALPPIDASGAAKLLVVSRALRLRRDRPELFTGYTPVGAVGDRAAHVVAFDRGGAVTVATRLPVALAEAGGWGTTTVALDAPAVDVLTGQEHPAGDVPVADLLAVYPVALLAPLGGTA